MRWFIYFLFVSIPVFAQISRQTDLSLESYKLESLRQAIVDLQFSFNDEYPDAKQFLKRIERLERSVERGKSIQNDLHQLQADALLSNPLLRDLKLLCIKRRMPDSLRAAGVRTKDYGFQWGGKTTKALMELGLPSNHECNSSLARSGYDNAVVVLDAVHPDATMRELYRAPDCGYLGEVDLHWNGETFLFTQSDSVSWKVFEYDLPSKAVRQVSQTPDDVDCGDACYMPNGKIVFGSTASLQSVPCWHGQRRVSNLFVMNADGTGMRQVCFDQDHDFHPTMLPNGQVLYHRWDYTGISHIYLRQLMVMNPDGTGQRAVYGSNSWFPNSLYFPQAIPGSSSKFVAILSGYYGAHRMGQLVVVDTQQGFHDDDGLVQRISGRGQRIEPKIRDNLVDDDWPKFLHPYPLSEKYFLVSAWINPGETWGIYLTDVFDNVVLIKKVKGYALLEPVPLQQRKQSPILPNRVKPENNQAVIYMHDVYAGPGLQGVPRGVVQSLRVLAYDFGYPGLAGPHKIGIGGPWEAMQILGTVPLEEDGSVMFYAPANTPMAFQALDSHGKAVQLMRSWMTAMPGETASCVGCHESPAEIAPTRRTVAGQKRPRTILEWYGPARGFDFEREVQPVLTAYCVRCHDGSQSDVPDLRSETQVPEYIGSFPSTLGVERMHPDMKQQTGGRVKYTPAYEALLPYVRRVSIEDDVNLLVPGELHADTSPLIQLLKRGHQNVRLDAESWDRIITWIDLNAPCHGTWNDVFPVPNHMCERRDELRQLYGGPPIDPNYVPNAALISLSRAPEAPHPIASLAMERSDRKTGNAATRFANKDIELGDQIITMIRISADPPFWISETEVTNAQFRMFDPSHDSRYYNKRHKRHDDKGIDMNQPDQPVVRVSWNQAQAFCGWLAERSTYTVQLPTAHQWLRAADLDAYPLAVESLQQFDVGSIANLADTSFSHGFQKNGLQVSGGVQHLHLEGARLADQRIQDGAVVTTTVASYEKNRFGLYDMIGNASEWTRDRIGASQRAVAVGGSFFDHPGRIHPVDYPAWQRVFNVGFRIVIEEE